MESVTIMRVNGLLFNESRKWNYLRNTLDIINGENKVIDFIDLIFFFRTLKKERRYPFPDQKDF